MATRPPHCDVVIVGGGPGGLSTALGLTRAVKNIRVKVGYAHYPHIWGRNSQFKVLMASIACPPR